MFKNQQSVFLLFVLVTILTACRAIIKVTVSQLSSRFAIDSLIQSDKFKAAKALTIEVRYFFSLSTQLGVSFYSQPYSSS